MSAAPASSSTSEKLTSAEYLAREHHADWRSEYADGRVVAMSGASLPHNYIVANLHETLGPMLRQRGCVGVSHDLRVRVESQDCYFYPDFIVICGPLQIVKDVTDTLLNPRLLIEVLSPSTEGFDRGKKFFHYQQIPSLREYVLVSQDRPLVEVYTRQSDASWRYEAFSGLTATAAVASVEATLPLAELYREVSFAA